MASTQHILNTREGLDRLMGDDALYRQLLLRFRKDYGQAGTQIAQLLAGGAHAAALRKAHGLKGAAGMIGALALHRLAGEVEAALAAWTPPDAAPASDTASMVGTIRKTETGSEMTQVVQPGGQAPGRLQDQLAVQLPAALDSLLHAILSYVNPAQTHAESGTTQAMAADAETRALLGRLAQLLDDGNGAAIDVLEQSATQLAAGLGVAMFQDVAAAAHEFDFESALALLTPALNA